MSTRFSQAEGSSGVSAADWRKLYRDIGSDIAMKTNAANDIETSDRLTLDLSSKIEALQEVREQMRAIDPALPLERADEL